MKRTKRTDCKIDVKQNPGVARIVGFATSYFEQFCLVAYQGLTSSFEGGFHSDLEGSKNQTKLIGRTVNAKN